MNCLKYIIKNLKHSQTLVLMIIYQVNAVPKVSFLFPQMLSRMSTKNPGDYYFPLRLFQFEILEKV